MITCEVIGGLGNQMFVIATAWACGRRTGSPFVLYRSLIRDSCTKHSSMDYLGSIFSGVTVVDDDEEPRIDRRYHECVPTEVDEGMRVLLTGYLQSFRYFDGMDLAGLFTLQDMPSIPDTCFVHFRRGDYVGHPLHDVVSTTYYRRAMDTVLSRHPQTTFLILSNDVEGVLTTHSSWLSGYTHRTAQEDELTSLVMMTRCAIGGIAANSTFSWWGLYLNRDRPVMIVPSVWFGDPSIPTDGYFFPGVEVICSS